MLVFVLAVVAGVLVKMIGLPSIIGQVAVGLLVGLSGILSPESVNGIELLGSAGIALLLFLVGLEMNGEEIKRVGGAVIRMFLIQTSVSVLFFFLVARYILDLGVTASALIAVSLSFSSTIVVVKLLSEKKDLNSLTGRLSLGILLLQDLLAIVLLVFLPSINQKLEINQLFSLLFRLVVLVALVNVIGQKFISTIFKAIIKSGDDLVLLSLCWYISVVSFGSSVLKLSPEVSSFLAGLSLSTSWGHFQIINKVKTLRDIFLTMFFVLLGLKIGPGGVNWLLVGELVLLVMAVKFGVTVIAGRISGLTGRIVYSVAINVGQISEFSLIVMGLGVSLGIWSGGLVKLITLVGLISMTISTLLISNSGRIYRALIRLMKRKVPSSEMKKVKSEFENHVVLIGCDRTGTGIIDVLKHSRQKFLVIDFNPEVVRKLIDRGVVAIFGDAADPEIVDLANLAKAKLIISTIKDVDDSLALMESLKENGVKTNIIVDAETFSQAKELYAHGADYVVFPHFVSGWHLGQVLKKHLKDKRVLNAYRKKQKTVMKGLYDESFS